MYYIQSICNAHFGFENRVSSSLCYPENHICRHEGATDPPKSASRHSQNAVSLPVRGPRVQRLSLPLTRRRLNGFISNPSSEERGQSPAARRSDAVCTSPLGDSEGLWGDGKAARRSFFNLFFPKVLRWACFFCGFFFFHSLLLAFFAFLAFFFAFPCFFCLLFYCFSLLFCCLSLLFLFAEACKWPGLFYQLGIWGEKRPFLGTKAGFFPKSCFLGGILLQKESVAWVSKFLRLLLCPVERPTNIQKCPKAELLPLKMQQDHGAVTLEKLNYTEPPSFGQKESGKSNLWKQQGAALSLSPGVLQLGSGVVSKAPAWILQET